MCDTVHENGKQSGIRINDLVLAECSGVAVIGCLYIRFDQLTDAAESPHKFQCNASGLQDVFRILFPAQNNRNLFGELVDHILDQHRKIIPHRIDLNGSILEIPGENDLSQTGQNIDDDLIIRVIENFHLVDRFSVFVVIQQVVHNCADIFFHFLHGQTSPFMYKHIVPMF